LLLFIAVFSWQEAVEHSPRAYNFYYIKAAWHKWQAHGCKRMWLGCKAFRVPQIAAFFLLADLSAQGKLLK